MKAADNPDSEQVSALLSEAKTMAFQLKEDAATMETFTRSKASWQSHAAAIAQMKEHFNALSAQVDKLKAAKATASPWQKTAIDRIDPFLNEMSGYTEAVIEQLEQASRAPYTGIQGLSRSERRLFRRHGGHDRGLCRLWKDQTQTAGAYGQARSSCQLNAGREGMDENQAFPSWHVPRHSVASKSRVPARASKAKRFQAPSRIDTSPPSP